ncbi:SDR family NAD(P)-dependent oxidoreductase [Streptomyces sp. NPDC004532]
MASTPPATDRPARIALVTGGNRGLGRSVVESLAAAGTDIVFTFRSHEEEAKEVVDAVAALGRTAVPLHLDTTQTQTFAAFTDRLRQALQTNWGRDSLDILVNNAGFSGSTVLGATDEKTIDELFAVHVKGVYLLTQALATAEEDAEPLLADGGRIINLSSGLARFVTAPYAVYGAMKGAVEVLTRYWAVELGSRGISVNTIAPGPVATDFADGYLRASQDVQKAMSGMTALGRVAHAEDIGPAVAALTNEGTHWITGQRIEASGGFRM